MWAPGRGARPGAPTDNGTLEEESPMTPYRRSFGSWWNPPWHFAKGEESGSRWITIGGAPSEDGTRKHVGGSPVLISSDGRILRGAPALTGRKLGATHEEPQHGSHRQQLIQEKQYRSAVWNKKAKQAGIDPAPLRELADSIIAHDREHTEERRNLVRDARATLERNGYNPNFLTHHLRTGKVENNIPFLDELTDEMAKRYPAQFNGFEDPENRMISLLAEGTPTPLSEQEAFEHAFSELERLRDSGGAVPDYEPSENIFGDEEPEPLPFSRTEERPAMQTTWDRLTPAQLNRRASTVLQFARGMGLDSRNGEEFDAADRLTDLLGPDANLDRIEQRLEDARTEYRAGRLGLDAAALGLVRNCTEGRTGTDPGRVKRLERIFRLALAQEIPFAKAARDMLYDGAESPLIENVPNSAGTSTMPTTEVRRMARDSQAIRFRRATGEPLRRDDMFSFTRADLDACLSLMKRRPGITFDQACKIIGV
jgi:hypothetical protein